MKLVQIFFVMFINYNFFYLDKHCCHFEINSPTTSVPHRQKSKPVDRIYRNLTGSHDVLLCTFISLAGLYLVCDWLRRTEWWDTDRLVSQIRWMFIFSFFIPI